MLLRAGLKSLRAFNTMTPGNPTPSPASSEPVSPYLTYITPEEVAIIQAHRAELRNRRDERQKLIHQSLTAAIEGWELGNSDNWPGTIAIAQRLEKALVHYGLIKDQA